MPDARYPRARAYLDSGGQHGTAVASGDGGDKGAGGSRKADDGRISGRLRTHY